MNPVAAPRISTPRLEMIAATATLARAGVCDRARFAAILGVKIPAAWPPDVLADVQEYVAQQLEKGAAVPGWWHWYAVTASPRVLIGSGGFTAQPDDIGTVTLGYSIAPGYEGQGYCSEMVEGLVTWAQDSGRVKRIHATTFARHYASVRVLVKNGFTCRGISAEDAGAAESERQGRGPLMLFVREVA
jgi:ribosomal-protein-alanine N-acetyltransferase